MLDLRNGLCQYEFDELFFFLIYSYWEGKIDVDTASRQSYLPRIANVHKLQPATGRKIILRHFCHWTSANVMHMFLWGPTRKYTVNRKKTSILFVWKRQTIKVLFCNDLITQLVSFCLVSISVNRGKVCVACCYILCTYCSPTMLAGSLYCIKILTWLRGFQDKLLYLGLFSLYPSLFLGNDKQKKRIYRSLSINRYYKEAI